ISTLLLPDRGTVLVFGLDVVRDELEVKQLINRVSVDAAFFKKLSPMENLLYAARLYGLGADEARRRGLEILERLSISRKVALDRRGGGGADGGDVAWHAAEGRDYARAVDVASVAAPGRANHRTGSAIQEGRPAPGGEPARGARRDRRPDNS